MKRILVTVLTALSLLLSLSCSSEDKKEQQALEELIRQPVGNFKLTKSYSSSETREQASGFVSTLIKDATAATGGEFHSQTNEKVVVLMTTQSSPERAGELVQNLYQSIQQDKRGWDSSTITPFMDKSGKETGKKIYAVDGMRHGMFVWNNGARLFLVASDNQQTAQDFKAATPY